MGQMQRREARNPHVQVVRCTVRYPPGNESISHLVKSKIIFKGMGYVSFPGGQIYLTSGSLRFSSCVLAKKTRTWSILDGMYILVKAPVLKTSHLAWR